MPLVSIDGPTDYRGGEVEFAMRDPDDPARRPHLVTVTLGALDGLAAPDLSGHQLAEWVQRHRAEFEAIASAKYDAGLETRITVNDWIARFPMPE